MELMTGFSSENIKRMLATTLRLYVGRGKPVSWEALADSTGIKEGTLRSYVAADAPLMPMDTFMEIFTRLPSGAFANVARHMGFSAAPSEVDDEATVRRVLSQSARLVADGNEFLEDGKLTPSERAKLAERAGELLPALTSIATGSHATH